MTASASNRGLLLVGHGSRSERGTAEFLSVAARCADRSRPHPCEVCFLELREPSIADGVARLVRRGIRKFTVVPTLLFRAGHARHDIPSTVDDALAGLGEPCRWFAAPPLELHPRLLELSVIRASAALEAAGLRSEDTELLVVGRGGTDRSAHDMCRRYTAALSERLGTRSHGTAFVVTPEEDARPKPALQSLVDRGVTAVLVQPHLLFAGEVLDSISRDVAFVQSAIGTQCRLVQSPHLGASRLVAEALLDVAQGAQPAHEDATAVAHTPAP
jgi:sirohydrochlorin ferrochelatase